MASSDMPMITGCRGLHPLSPLALSLPLPQLMEAPHPKLMETTHLKLPQPQSPTPSKPPDRLVVFPRVIPRSQSMFIPTQENLTRPEPMPYMPAGGINTSPDDIPVYQAFSDFDWQSLSLALYQEWIELDLFQEGLRRFSVEDLRRQILPLMIGL
ncbi:hypothetical protein BZA77DRAFT_368279 [Pyronema omphalodes]|nr:hypothetical protein BZA77DRAFT_368279 [Pyronema omphalodes]